MIGVTNVSGGYSSVSVLKDISFSVKKGQLFGILGPNGSGKTTLLKMLSGVLTANNGEILIKGHSISSYSSKKLAKVMAVLPQNTTEFFSYTVKETVSLGRYAHQDGWFNTWSEKDEITVQKVMEQTGIIEYQHHSIQQLSGGERQRVFLAQALAQEPEILLLDEPTNHLDLSYQKELLDLLKRWTKEQELTVLSIFHDLNLAGLYCDQLLLLKDGQINIDSYPNEVLKEERIKNVYQTEIKKHPHPHVPAPQMLLLPDSEYQEGHLLEINESFLSSTEECIVLVSPEPLKTMSSGVIGSGSGWYQNFINRHVAKTYNCSNHREEMKDFIQDLGYGPSDTVGMMTAVNLGDVSYEFYQDGEFSIFVVVTAGVGNAIDASKSELHSYELEPGTINTWVFVNGKITEEAFIQSIMTATESKVKVLHDQKVKDSVTGTLATGTSTDSILIASTQQGKELEYAGTITPLGKMISKGIYECTTNALNLYRKRVKT
ncbi:iron complex transport system ATP-binding protein [Bacillus pakistanensis]|uniref:Iron complex transport system ATP-binding protein n=1 Tax=Rossellomorea pakistanensis TaxID=992288 RepID=A0ABS2N7S1_9BACI|nr:adenosylcobinamide amidohydrolase [Bacillus pakistanensis]MBM7583834.1 iron complex transport system ATP-binding protein [Bacillus pakistanensis]